LTDSPLAPHSASPRELKEQIAAGRLGIPFLIYRDADDTQQVRPLEGDRLTIGRDPASDVSLWWDDETSRAHAELVRVGGRWAVVDDGLSRNGSFVNGERVTRRRALKNGDMLRFGTTAVAFREQVVVADSTKAAESSVHVAKLSPTQLEVLRALCRPLVAREGVAMPATNQQIADALFLSVDAVKKHLRSMFQKFEIDDLPQNQKRARLAELALRAGLVSSHDAN
jgi:pSer/pThr/pTyr-binding forkhead associated (FHA) protein